MLKDGLEEPKRKELQNSVNPCYIPRNHLLQGVIAEAEKGNYKAVSHSCIWWAMLVYFPGINFTTVRQLSTSLSPRAVP